MLLISENKIFKKTYKLIDLPSYSHFNRSLQHGYSIEEASKCFEEIPATNMNLKVIETLNALPVEHLQGQIEAVLTLLILSVPEKSCSTNIKKLMARSFFNGFRTPSILKYLSVEIVVKMVTKTPLDQLSDQSYCLTCIKSIFKAGVTYTKPLDEIVENLTFYSEPLETLNDQQKVLVSICLLESLQPILKTSLVKSGLISSSEDGRRKKCETIFKSLSKALLKGLKSNSTEIEANLIIGGLTSSIDILCSKNDNAKQLKKWNNPINDYVSFCAATPKEQSSLLFLSVILENYSTLQETLTSDDIFSKFLKSDVHRKPVESVEETLVLKLLVQVTSEHNSDFFTKILDEMLEATHEAKDLQMLRNWTAFAMTKIAKEDMLVVRKKYFVQILSLLRPTKPKTSPDGLQFSHYYLPILELQQALLDSEKPILSKEGESFILAQSLSINLNNFLETETSENFNQCWNAIYKVLSNAFHKRSSSLVTPRIPLIMAGLRSLLSSLASAGSQKRNLEPSDLKEVVTLSYNFDRLCEHVKKLKDEFARVSPYLISDVMEAFQQETLYPNVRTNVLHGVHKLLDICDSHSIEYLSSVLPSGKQEIFKHLFSNYKQYYKYAGRV